MPRQRFAYTLPLMILILLIAAGVRFHDLGAQSLWYDEGVAYGHSQRSLFEMIPRLQNNVHVPAYFGSLALWEDFLGSSEFGLRSYSALWSVLGVAAAYALGKRLFSPMAALAAAALVALNSFNIFYAQEARMYAMLATIGTLSMWTFVGFVKNVSVGAQHTSPLHKRNYFRWAMAFAVLNIVGAYTHVSYVLVMLVQGAMALLTLLDHGVAAIEGRRPFAIFKRVFIVYVGVNLLTVLAFLPWLFTALSQVSAQPNISDSIPLGEYAPILLGWLAYGRTYQDTLGGMGVVIYFLLIFGLIRSPGDGAGQRWTLLLPVVWVVLSVTLYSLLGLYTRYLRFLLPAQIGMALWMGRGFWVLWHIVPRAERQQRFPLSRYAPKLAASVALAAFCFSLIRGISPLYNDPLYQRDDYRQLVAIIEAESLENDAIILSAPGLQEIFGYYYDGDLPIYPLPAGDDIRGDTLAILDRHQRVYVVLYGASEQDPEGVLLNTLNSAAYQISAEWVDNVRLERYVAPVVFNDLIERDAQFGDAIVLARYGLSTTQIKANDALQIQLQWTTNAAIEERYKVFVQLLNQEGVLVAQRDSEPSGGAALTTLWQPDDIIIDNHALSIPPDLPAGDYDLIIGLYDAGDPASRLPVGDGDFLKIGTIEVVQ